MSVSPLYFHSYYLAPGFAEADYFDSESFSVIPQLPTVSNVQYFNSDYLFAGFAEADYFDSIQQAQHPGNMYSVNVLFDTVNTFGISLPVLPGLSTAQYFSSNYFFNGYAQSDYFDLASITSQRAGNIYAVNVLFDTADVLQVNAGKISKEAISFSTITTFNINYTKRVIPNIVFDTITSFNILDGKLCGIRVGIDTQNLLQINTAHITSTIVAFDTVNTFFVDSIVAYIPFMDFVTTFAVNAGRITPNQILVDVSNTFSVDAISLFGSTIVDIETNTDYFVTNVLARLNYIIIDSDADFVLGDIDISAFGFDIDVTTELSMFTGNVISAPIIMDVTTNLIVDLITTDILGVKLVYFTLTSIDSVYFTVNTFRFKNV